MQAAARPADTGVTLGVPAMPEIVAAQEDNEPPPNGSLNITLATRCRVTRDLYSSRKQERRPWELIPRLTVELATTPFLPNSH